MAEKRPKSASILLKFPSKDGDQQTEKIDLFASELWKTKPGLFRAQVNGKWRDNPDGKKLFLSLSQALRLVADLFGGHSETLHPVVCAHRAYHGRG